VWEGFQENLFRVIATRLDSVGADKIHHYVFVDEGSA
jgi:hypothetical protein